MKRGKSRTGGEGARGVREVKRVVVGKKSVVCVGGGRRGGGLGWGERGGESSGVRQGGMRVIEGKSGIRKNSVEREERGVRRRREVLGRKRQRFYWEGPSGQAKGRRESGVGGVGGVEGQDGGMRGERGGVG